MRKRNPNVNKYFTMLRFMAFILIKVLVISVLGSKPEYFRFKTKDNYLKNILLLVFLNPLMEI